MSDHGQAAHAEPSGGHDYSYHGEPADRPGADEPHTPGWMPLLGIGLVLAGILGFIISKPAAKPRSELTVTAEGAAAPAPEPVKAEAQAAEAPVERRPPRPLPSGLRPGMMPGASPHGAGSAVPRRPGAFALPGGSAAPARRPDDPHFGHNHP